MQCDVMRCGAWMYACTHKGTYVRTFVCAIYIWGHMCVPVCISKRSGFSAKKSRLITREIDTVNETSV